MKIQLIRYHDIGNVNSRLTPSLNKRQGVLPPLGLAYIAAALEQAGHQVDLVDAIALEMGPEALRARMQRFAPQVVGITAMTPTFRGALAAAQIAKQAGAITVMGGVHLSLYPKETLSHPCIDYGVLGEGEESSVELCHALEQQMPIDDIKGIAFKANGKIIVGSPRIIENINTLPMPAYHLLPMHAYRSIIGKKVVSSIMGSRGCPYRCSFCYKTPSDRRYRHRSAENIVTEMEYLINNHGVLEVMFYDDLMTPAYVTALCNEILHRGVKIAWQTPQRVDLVRQALLPLMAAAGCHLLRLGVEQGDPEMMRRIDKKITLEQVRKVFKWVHAAHINTFAYFMIGYPGETPESMTKTIRLARELDPEFVMFTRTVPLPDTPLMQQAVDLGLVEADYWQRFTLGEEMPPIPPLVANADDFVKKAYRSFYLRPGYILKQLSKIKNMDDVRKNMSGFFGLLE
jgi:anaerobic magnesium-protoporphyrin IX monomethyl ester cyclase